MTPIQNIKVQPMLTPIQHVNWAVNRFFREFKRPGRIHEISAHSGTSQYFLRKWLDRATQEPNAKIESVWVDVPVHKMDRQDLAGIVYYRKAWAYQPRKGN